MSDLSDFIQRLPSPPSSPPRETKERTKSGWMNLPSPPSSPGWKRRIPSPFPSEALWTPPLQSRPLPPPCTCRKTGVEWWVDCDCDGGWARLAYGWCVENNYFLPIRPDSCQFVPNRPQPSTTVHNRPQPSTTRKNTQKHTTAHCCAIQ